MAETLHQNYGRQAPHTSVIARATHPPTGTALGSLPGAGVVRQASEQVGSKSSPVTVTLRGFAETSHTCGAPRLTEWGFSILQDATLCVGRVPN
jgi:hypothetical protein